MRSFAVEGRGCNDSSAAALSFGRHLSCQNHSGAISISSVIDNIISVSQEHPQEAQCTYAAPVTISSINPVCSVAAEYRCCLMMRRLREVEGG